MRKDVGIVITDTHVLSAAGLLPPSALDDDGAKLMQNKAQTWLWQKWLLTRAAAELHVPEDGGKRWLFNLGDIQEGRHHNSTQIGSLNPDTMRRISVDVHKPWLDWCDYAFMIRGTGAHAGPAGSDEESIANALAAYAPGKVQRDPLTDRASTFHRSVQIQKATFDLAHQPKSSTSRDYLAHGPAGVTAMACVLDHLRTGSTPPTVAFRGHLHPRKRVYDSGLTYETRAVVCPCWKLADEYGARLGPGEINIVGAVFFTVIDSHVDLWPVTYLPKRARTWTEPQ